MSRVLALVAVLALAACSGAASVPSSSPGQPGTEPGRQASDSGSGMPDGGTTLPAEHAQGLPGEHAQGLPGANFACTDVPPQGAAKCTIAINLNVAPNGNPTLPAAQIPGLHPADLASAYALPTQNAGGLVAIVDAFDAPAAESDLAVYRTAFGLPACTTANGCFRKVNQTGGAAPLPAPDAGWAQEVALDLEMVSAACPKCTILLVEANSALLDDLGASVDTAVSLGAMAVSNSYYALEWSDETNEDVHYRHTGVAITAASGDRGYPSYPAASWYVTSVGGTSLTPKTGGGWTESAWPYTGHGCSAFITKAPFQDRTNTGCRKRSTVDVAAVADPQTGVSMFQAAAGGWLVAGGTSVGAPLIASAYALAGQGRNAHWAYLHPGAFHDVPPRGYDAVTGLGSPNGIGGF